LAAFLLLLEGIVATTFVINPVTGRTIYVGYPSGGNYWSDYAGTALHRGPYQNEPNSDGIADTPYVIDTANADNYPLMNP
jgi:hypothetical protein